MKRQFITVVLICFSCIPALAQSRIHVLYKQVDTTALYLDVLFPENYDTTVAHPAIIFFFGGGWVGGNIRQFEPHAMHYTSKGIIACLVDYRVANRQHTTPFESLKDAKSAIRFIREHAAAYHIDPNRIIAAGGSAGGQLAAATALIKGFNEISDNLSVSCIPNALVLFNPVIDNGPGGYGYERIGDQYKNFSPLHNIMKGAPPTILFFGTKDKYVPVETAKYYQTVMQRVGSKCELFLYEGQSHGFFNYEHHDNYEKTIAEADKFLSELGYLP